MTASRVPVLPTYIAEYLVDNRKNPGELYPLLLSLHEAGWSLAALAAPFGVTRESIRLWLNRARDAGAAIVAVPAPPAETAGQASEREHRAAAQLRREASKALIAEYLPRLKELQGDAQALRGPSESNARQAAASAEYTRLLNEVISRGASPTPLARALGIQVVTINARLRRGGYRRPAPSERQPRWAAALPQAG